MKDCPMCGCDRKDDPNTLLPLCTRCTDKLKSILGAGFEGCQYSPEDRADAFEHWNKMDWIISELFVRIARLEDLH